MVTIILPYRYITPTLYSRKGLKLLWCVREREREIERERNGWTDGDQDVLLY